MASAFKYILDFFKFYLFYVREHKFFTLPINTRKFKFYYSNSFYRNLKNSHIKYIF